MSFPYPPHHTYGTRGNSPAHTNNITPGTCLSCFERAENCPHVHNWTPNVPKIRSPRKCRPSKPYSWYESRVNGKISQPTISTPVPKQTSHFTTPYPFDAYVRDFEDDEDPDLFLASPVYDTPPPKFTTSQCAVDPGFVDIRTLQLSPLPNPFYELQGQFGFNMPQQLVAHPEISSNGHGYAGTNTSQNAQAGPPVQTHGDSHFDEAVWYDQFLVNQDASGLEYHTHSPDGSFV
jgi:hypothetical protein